MVIICIFEVQTVRLEKIILGKCPIKKNLYISFIENFNIKVRPNKMEWPATESDFCSKW